MGRLFLVVVKNNEADPLRWVMEKNSNDCFDLGEISLSNRENRVSEVAEACHLINFVNQWCGGTRTWFEKVMQYLQDMAKSSFRTYEDIDLNSGMIFQSKYSKYLKEMQEDGYDPLKRLKYKCD